MVIAKPERKDFGLRPEGRDEFHLRPFSASEPGANGHAKSAGSLFGSLGYSLTPRLAGREEISRPYEESWVVHACLRAYADAIEQVPFAVWTGPEDTASKLDESHPVVRLLKRPNPWTTWSQHASMGSIHRNLSGEDFWFMANANGQPITSPEAYDPTTPIDLPAAIYSVNGACVADERDAAGRVKVWKYGTASGKTNVFPAGSVLHFRNYDPSDPCRGIGPVEVAMRQLSIAFQAERYGEATLRSGGPGAFIVFKQEMAAETQKDFQDQLDGTFRDPRSAGTVKVITGEAVVTPIPSNPKDMLSMDQLAWSRDVVASLLGVPLPIIGVLSNATYSNMKEAWRQFWLKVAAYMNSVEDVVNTSFFARLRDPALRKLRFGFDLSNVLALKADEADLIKAAGEVVAKGVGVSFNDSLDLLGVQAEHPPTGDARLYTAQMQTAPNPPRVEKPTVSPRFIQLLLEELEKCNS